jgi:hypothetical protein
MATVPNGTTTGGPKTQNRCIHFLGRTWLANEEAVSLSIVRHQSACFNFRRTTRHAVSVRNVERSRHILRMPFVVQDACPLLIPFILSDASQVPLIRKWPVTPAPYPFCSPMMTPASSGQWFVIMSLLIASTRTAQHAAPTPWMLPDRAFTILYGCPEMPRISHYFFPRILLNQRRVLYLDGANQISPLLIARFARERGLDPSAFNTLIRVSRAFT